MPIQATQANENLVTHLMFPPQFCLCQGSTFCATSNRRNHPDFQTNLRARSGFECSRPCVRPCTRPYRPQLVGANEGEAPVPGRNGLNGAEADSLQDRSE